MRLYKIEYKLNGRYFSIMAEALSKSYAKKNLISWLDSSPKFLKIKELKNKYLGE